MFKHTSFLRFATEIERAEGLRRWRDELGPLELEIPGVVRYVQNPVVVTTTNDGAVEGPPGFDGLTSMGWVDRATYDAAIASPEWAKAQEHAHQLVDPAWWERGMSAMIEERIKRVGMGAADDGMSTPPGSPIKLVGLLRYRDGMTRDEANHYWTTHHGDIALTIREMGHYVQNHAIAPTSGSESDPLGFDGYSEAWFDDIDTYERAMASEPWHDLVDDGPALFDMSVFLSGIVEEDVRRG